MRVIGLNTLFIFGGFSGFELLPAYAKNEAGVDETAIGIVFFVNTVVIVLDPAADLPQLRRTEPHEAAGPARAHVGDVVAARPDRRDLARRRDARRS